MTCAAGIRTSGAELLYAPEPGAWAGLLRSPPTADAAAKFRQQLGLPTDAPIVMSGHQAGLWHCGILAKRLAAEAFAQSINNARNARTAWLLVDHDANDAGALRVPTHDDGAVGEALVRFGAHENEVPTGLRPPGGEPHIPGDIDDAVRAQLERALADLPDGAPNLAARAHAAVDAACDRLGCAPMPVISSLSLARTDLFERLLERVRTDPARCRATYNAAVRDMRPLADTELPLWVVEPGQARRPAHDSDLDKPLAPRALLMTGLVRAAACDLFVHGTGGYGDAESDGYDAQTETWFADYFADLPELAHAVVASATLRLPLAAGDVPTDDELEHARWLARSAAHNPELLGEDELAEKKKALVARAEELKVAGEKPAAVFAEMRAMLDDYRARRAGDLAELERAAERAERLKASEALLGDRTWPFVLFQDEILCALRADVRRAFGLS